jgi:hypothetical protein
VMCSYFSLSSLAAGWPARTRHLAMAHNGLRPQGYRPRTLSYVSTTQRACRQYAVRHAGSGHALCRYGRGDLPLALPLAEIQEVVEHANPELEGADWHALVHAMEHAREVELWRQTERSESEAPDSQPGE